jgi:hypothetical protein
MAVNFGFAQKVQVNLYGGYVFDDKISSYYSDIIYFDGKVKGGFQWGAGLEYLIRSEYGVELLYYRQDTHAPINYQTLFEGGVENVDLGVNYIMLGGNRHKAFGDGNVDGYGGLLAGVGIVSGETSRFSETLTKFAWGIRLGCNIWAGEKVGVKLQAQLLSIAQGAGGGVYFGTGGAGVGVSTYSTIYQFGFSGGLVFKLGQ